VLDQQYECRDCDNDQQEFHLGVLSLDFGQWYTEHDGVRLLRAWVIGLAQEASFRYGERALSAESGHRVPTKLELTKYRNSAFNRFLTNDGALNGDAARLWRKAQFVKKWMIRNQGGSDVG
jgi:hypothetical protein